MKEGKILYERPRGPEQDIYAKYELYEPPEGIHFPMAHGIATSVGAKSKFVYVVPWDRVVNILEYAVEHSQNMREDLHILLDKYRRTPAPGSPADQAMVIASRAEEEEEE